MFSNVVAIGHYAWTPSSRTLFDDDDDENQSTRDIDVNEEENLNERSGGSEEDVILNYTDDVCNLVVGVNMGNSSTTNSNGKRKVKEQCGRQSRKKSKKPYGFGAQLLSCWDQLLDRVSIRNDSRDKIVVLVR
jgi:hypothetical protein